VKAIAREKSIVSGAITGLTVLAPKLVTQEHVHEPNPRQQQKNMAGHAVVPAHVIFKRQFLAIHTVALSIASGTAGRPMVAAQ
jgi:hypothetical protein